MTTTGQDFTIYAGEAVDVDFPTLTGTGLDLTTATTVRWTCTIPAGDIVKTSGSGLTVNGATDCTVTLTSADTDDLTTGRYDHALWWQDASGKWSALSVGQMKVLEAAGTPSAD